MLAAHAAQALAALAAGKQELGALAGLQTGTIRLGASTAPGSYLLPDTLGCFRRDYPAVDVEIEIAASGQILRRLLASRIELAIVGVDKADDRIALEPFLADEIVGVRAARPRPGKERDARSESPRRANAALPRTRLELAQLRRGRTARDRHSTRARLGTRLHRSRQESRPRRARRRLPLLYAVAEEIERGELNVFRLRGRPRLTRDFQIARLASRPLSPAESAFVTTLTRCCAKQATYAQACIADNQQRSRAPNATPGNGIGSPRT
ncbi:MAG TPA: LysR substrate-binding domain-containing protein [Gaiellaceae bacterium]|nr:LysR substrate-binding domain-containing protein [Gaiellaceae bacterium]